MGWATEYIKKLQNGEVVQFRPRGGSMTGRINSGNLVTVVPVSGDINKNDIVLCKVKGSQYLHIVKALDGNRYQIGNNKGRINGWITMNSIFGICTKIEP